MAEIEIRWLVQSSARITRVPRRPTRKACAYPAEVEFVRPTRFGIAGASGE